MTRPDPAALGRMHALMAMQAHAAAMADAAREAVARCTSTDDREYASARATALEGIRDRLTLSLRQTQP